MKAYASCFLPALRMLFSAVEPDFDLIDSPGSIRILLPACPAYAFFGYGTWF